MAQETKKITELTALSAFTLETLFVTHDGTGARKATMQQLWDFFPMMGNNAGAHNGIYRGKRLGTTTPTAEQFAAISAGTFKDMYIGDYWTINSVTWRIVAFDYYMNCGDNNGGTETFPGSAGDVTFNYIGKVSAHHVTIMPDTVITVNVPMNTSNTTDGGYAGSKMRRGVITYSAAAGTDYYDNADLTGDPVGQLQDATTVTPQSGATPGYASFLIEETTYYVNMTAVTSSYDVKHSGLYDAKNQIIAAFGASHILAHRKYLQDTVANGVCTAGAWYNSFCEIPTEMNMYGTTIYKAMNSNNVLHVNATVDKSQFPLFRFRPDLIHNKDRWFWLQDVVTSQRFAFVGNLGYVLSYASSYHYNSGGVRPVFSIIG